MNIARKAAWLCGCAIALVPQTGIGSTSQIRLAIGVTVVTPCRVSTGALGVLSCAGRDSQDAAFAIKDETALNPPIIQGAKPKSAKFVEVSF